jgi:CHAT domain-containing protein/tetratricopeptide (TPR) repeat protein
MMNCAYRIGLALLVNLTIVSGAVLPGIAGSIGPTIAQAESSSELESATVEGNRLLKIGSKESLTAAISQFHRALQLSKSTDKKSKRALLLMALGQAHYTLGELSNDPNKPIKALEYYYEAQSIWQSIGDQLEEANVLNHIGAVYDSLGNKTEELKENYKNEARKNYYAALSIWRSLGNKPMEVMILNRIGDSYFVIRSVNLALKYYNQALSISRVAGDPDVEITILKNIVRVHSAMNEKAKVLETYNQILSTSQALGDRAMEAATLTHIGDLYAVLNQRIKSFDYYRRSLPIWQTVENRTMEIKILIHLGRIYDNMGEPNKALEYCNQALLISRKMGDQTAEASTLNCIGRAHFNRGEKNKALEYFKQALPISRMESDRSVEGNILNNIGHIYFDLGAQTQALEYFRQALSVRKAASDQSWVATTINNIGSIYANPNQQIKALDYDGQDFPVITVKKKKSGKAQQIKDVGFVYVELDETPQAPQVPQAIDYFNYALSIGNSSDKANAFGNLTKFYRNQNKLVEALQNIDNAIKIVESLRSEVQNDALKTSFFASVQGYYQLKTEILIQLNQQRPTEGYDAQALETTDQSRARTLRELLIQANANIDKDISPILLEQEQTLNQLLEGKEKQLVQLSSQPNQASQIPALNQEIAALYAQRDDLKNTIRATNPAYANLQYPKPITLKEIQQQLESDTLMLQYSIGEYRSYLWVISQNTLKTYILPKRSDIEKTSNAFHKELTAEATAPNSALLLTQQILAPAAGDLGNKRLVIIPDGILHTIPFAALNTPNSTTYNPLLTQHEITNLPSASTIGILRSTVATKPRGTKTLAILADPIFRKDDPRLTGKTIQANNNLDIGEQSARGRIGRDLDLNRLPFTETEAKGILALVPNQDSTAAFGFDASYDWITDPKIGQYRYVHLATHGFFDNDQPALSSIILSSFDAQGRDRKAFLRFPDLFNLNLPTELVVLSACETGLGNNVPGEGLVGMTRGLMYAGAMRVAVSLWSVDDRATSDLMQDFYKNLWQSKKSHAASLREAQLNMWKQGKAPYYWAAFTLQGEWRN